MNSFSLRDISVHFDDTQALRNVSFRIGRGEIHALLGEHGSGKTTLCNVMAGFVQPSSGFVQIDDRPFKSFTVRQAQTAGIRLVNQDNLLVETMSVASNLLLNNRAAMARPLVSQRRIVREAARYMSSWGLNIDPAEKAANLHEGDRLMVNLLKHLYTNPSLLILDESFEKLTAAYLEKAKRFLRRMCDHGMALLAVTHKVDELFEFAHNVAVLRKGAVLFEDRVEQTESLDLIRLAYTQMAQSDDLEDPGLEFYSLLKYNRAILERLPVNLMVLDSERKLKIVNESARSFLGLEDQDLYNVSWDSLAVAETSGISSIIEQAISTHAFGTTLGVSMDLHGQAVLADVTVFPIFEGSRFLGIIVLMSDVTEKEQMRERMMLAEKLTSIGLLSAGVAHEINNPLEIIANYVDHLRIRQSGSPEQERALAGIEEEIASIAQITKNLLLFGESGAVERETIECNSFISEIGRLVSHSAEAKGITLEVNVSEAPLHVSADRNELKQVVLNIARNAFEEMPQGGLLTISLQAVLKTRMGTPDELAERVACLSFRDSGPGLATETETTLFLPFYTTKEESQENLGLGLAISYSLIQKHGGTISARTHPEGGAEFIVELPVVDR